MKDTIMIELHSQDQEEGVWLVNVDCISAIGINANGARIYITGATTPIRVKETREEILEMLRNINQ